MIIFSSILTALDISISKLYQKGYGNTLKSGLIFNLMVGIFGTLIFLILNRFRVEFTVYSAVLGFVMTSFAIIYIIISFKILEEGKTAYYTLFRMTGSMLVPYVWGLFVLNEEFSVLRAIGMLLIITSIFIINAGKDKLSLKNVLMCISVFFLAGFVCVISKQHSISKQSISPVGYVVITSFIKVVICGGMLLLNKKVHTKKEDAGNKSGGMLHCIILCFLSAFVVGMSYMIQLICAKNMPATMLYPIITGGTIIFSALFARIFFKEKLSKKGISAIAVCFIGTLLYI